MPQTSTQVDRQNRKIREKIKRSRDAKKRMDRLNGNRKVMSQSNGVKRLDQSNGSKKSTDQSNDGNEVDHSSFLKAFERCDGGDLRLVGERHTIDPDPDDMTKPTQIYRYLRHRNAYSPIFLHRNLYFMKHRGRRKASTKLARKNFQIDSLLSVIEKKSLGILQSDTGYHQQDIDIVFTSFHQGQEDIADVDVELLLLRISHKKKKDNISSPVVRTSLGKVTLTANTPSISVPHSLFTLSTNGHRQSYRLLIQVTCSTHPQQLSDEPISKRRRSNRGFPVTPDSKAEPVPKVILSGELTIYDLHQRCDLTTGQYEIALHDPNQSATKTAPQWYNNNEISAKATSLEVFYSGPRLKFDLLWSPTTPDLNSPQPYRCINPPLNATAEELEMRPSDNLRNSPQRRRPTVVYHFLYNNNTRQQTESRTDTTCPWCSIQCGQLYSLLKHLRLSHSRFNFIYVPQPKGAKITVSINDRYDGSYVGNPHDLHSHIGYTFSRSKPVRRMPVTHIIVYRPRHGGESLSEFVEGGHETTVTREIIQGHNRMYYSSRTNRPIKPQDLDYNSESENDPPWLQTKTVQMIDEFTDVNEGEKELMKMWNLHMMRHNFVGNCQLADACSTFIRDYGEKIVAKKLQRNFILHVVNLFDFSLIKPDVIRNAVTQLGELSTAGKNVKS